MKTKQILLWGLLICALPILNARAGKAEGTPPEQYRKAGSVVAQLEVNFTHVYGLVYDTWHENGDAKAPVVPPGQANGDGEESYVIQFVDFSVPAKGRLFLDGVLKADAKYTYFSWSDNSPHVAAREAAGKRWWLFPGGPANWRAILLYHGAERSELKINSLTPTVKPAGGLLPNEGAACEPGKYRLVVKAPRSPDGRWRYPMSGRLRVWFVPEGDIGYVETIFGEGELFSVTRNRPLHIRDIVSFDEVIETRNRVSAKIIINTSDGQAVVKVKEGTRIVLQKKSGSRPKPGVFLFMGKIFSFFRSKHEGDGYSVVTSNFITGVEATAFEVSYDPAIKTSVCTVVEGLVNVQPLGTEDRLPVKAGQRVIVRDADPPSFEDVPADEINRSLVELAQDKEIFEGSELEPDTVPSDKGNAAGGRADGLLASPFTDDFSAGSAGWDLSDATPEMKDGKLMWNAGDFASASPKVEIPVENVIVEFDGWTETNGFNVYLWNRENKGYTVFMGGWQNTKSGSDIGGNDENRETVDGAVFTPGAWHHYKVERRGDTLAAYCDRKLVFTRTSSTRFSGPGRLRINSWMSRIGIDNVRISKAVGGGF